MLIYVFNVLLVKYIWTKKFNKITDITRVIVCNGFIIEIIGLGNFQIRGSVHHHAMTTHTIVDKMMWNDITSIIKHTCYIFVVNSRLMGKTYCRDLTCRTTINNLNMTRNNSLLITHYLGGIIAVDIFS